MEDEIGKIITLADGTKAIVEEADQMLPCSRCALWLTSDCEGRVCDRFARSDHKNILYRELEED